MRAEAVILKDVFPYLRRRLMFVRRSVYAGVAVFLVVMVAAGTQHLEPAEMALAGRFVFDAITWLILVAGVFECLIAGATSVSAERERNTVDLWVLAGMEQVTMVFAKALTVLARTASTLAAPVVPAAIAIFMGGRSVIDAYATFLAIISILVLTTAVSVAVSARSAKSSSSIPMAVFLSILAAVGPWALLALWAWGAVAGSGTAEALLKIHPFTILGEIGVQKFPGFILCAHLSLLLSSVLSLLILVAAGARLRLGAAATASRRMRPWVAADRVLKRIWPGLYRLLKPPPGDVDANPILWRERISFANAAGSMGVMTISDKLCLLAVMVLATPFVAVAMWSGTLDIAHVAIAVTILGVVTAFLYHVAFAVRASQAFSREFETGQMQLLRLTRLDGSQIVSGKMRAYAVHYMPALVITFVLACLAAGLMAIQLPDASQREASVLALFLTRAFAWPLGGVFLTAVALFCSLYYRSGLRALYATAVMGFLLPIAAWLVLGVFTCPFLALPWEIQLALRFVLAAGVLIWLGLWVRRYTSSRSYAKQECMIVMIFAVALLPKLGGVLIGAFGVYAIARRLLDYEFDAFFEDESVFYLEVDAKGRPSLSYEAGGVYALTHLGIPPSVESRLGKALERFTGRGPR